MKLKILELKSEEYPEGRIDSYKLEYDEDSHKILIPLFLGLGFMQEEVIEKLDRIFKEGENLFAYGNSEIKVHITTSSNELLLTFDTSIDKDKINRILDKHLIFPK